MKDSKSSESHVEMAHSDLIARLGELKATPTMVLFALWISVSAWICVYDFAYGGIVLTMSAFTRSFGDCSISGSPCQLSALQQSLMSLTSLFIALGGALGGFPATYLGRRGTMQIGSIVTAIGAAGMLGTSGSYLNYMVCKCLGAIGIGILYSTAPVYGAECVFPRQRGWLLALFNIGHSLGTLTAAAVCLGTAQMESDWAWKTPIACQIPLGVGFALSLFYFPESPRWLVLRQQTERAQQSLARFYHMEADAELVRQQLETIQHYINTEQDQRASVSFLDILRQGNLRRTLISSLVLFGLAISGIAFVTPYANLFLGNVGVSNPYLVSVYIGICTFAGALVGPPAVERLGRRVTMLSGYAGMATSMLVFAAVNTALGQTNAHAQRTVVAFICLWSFIFGASVGPTAWVASPEMHSVRLRTYGQAFSIAAYQTFSFAASFWSPYMIGEEYGNMGTAVGYFYCAVSMVVMVLIFLFMPETGRLSLEQIDDYFLSGRPAWRTSLGRNRLIMKGIQYSSAAA